jgi:hypothetical protein
MAKQNCRQIKLVLRTPASFCLITEKKYYTLHGRQPIGGCSGFKSEDVACMFTVGVQHLGRPEIFFSDLIQRHSIITIHNSDTAFPSPKPCLSTAY